MDKLRMQTANKADENFRKLAAMFPNAVTETINENGEVVRAIDKDVLMQEIACTVLDGNEERYQFTWPDKKKSVLLANAPINKTLRPVREDETVPTGADSEGKPYCSSGSVNFDTTENLYIEGDNLEVLKLLQETYLGKIKMIYIDPPYNTGSDLVYNDDFSKSTTEYIASSGYLDENGNRLVENLESNGRYHTDWLNMIYSRLRLAKDLLATNGVIFVSLDDNESANLKKICDEVFGAVNFIGQITVVGNPRGRDYGGVARMVQLPERTDEKSEAYKAGYKNICEIGKERIRRAGRKIKEDSPLTTQDLDIGFRVLKCDTSNMKEVYYNPAEYEASLFPRLEDNIKEDRTPEDLLFQVMLDLGVLLSSKIEETTIAGKKVFNVEDNYLIACFDSNVTEETIKAIAKQKPYYFVMRDSSMANDSVATNFDQIFATYSPDTVRKVL